MKKVFLSLAIVAALTVVSCKQAEAEATEAVDSVATVVVEEAAPVVDSAAAVVDSATKFLITTKYEYDDKCSTCYGALSVNPNCNPLNLCQKVTVCNYSGNPGQLGCIAN